jgi:hypothetical protein
MASQYRIERKQGTKESRKQVAALRTKWPAAFPVDPHLVRPLAVGSPVIIAQLMGWTVAYTLGVLTPWKRSPSYCRAVLSYARIQLDGTPTDEQPDAGAREQAKKLLANFAARKAAKAEPKAPPLLAELPQRVIVLETPEQLRMHVRASLMKRRA